MSGGIEKSCNIMMKKDDICEDSEKADIRNEGKNASEQRVAPPDNTEVAVWMSIWVWEEVLKFISRKEKANRFSVACHYLKAVCWPQLHGKKVSPRVVKRLFFEETIEEGKPKAILGIWRGQFRRLLRGREKIPIATVIPPPAYIRGFERIVIRYLDAEVLRFIRNVSPLLANMHLSLYQQHGIFPFAQLHNLLYALNGCAISCLDISSFSVSQLRQHVPGFLENIPVVALQLKQWDDRNDLKKLILAKLDSGRPFVLKIRYWGEEHGSSIEEPIDDIQKRFRTAVAPQSFYIDFHRRPTLEAFRRINTRTGEVLALRCIGDFKYELYRCPSGNVRQWREEAEELLTGENYMTRVSCDM